MAWETGKAQTSEHVAKRQATRKANHVPMYGDKYWRNSIKKKYGISVDQYLDMLEEQDNQCAICKRHQDEFENRLNVDHDHETGRVRGLLCQKCNWVVLPVIEKNPHLIEVALAYLKES